MTARSVPAGLVATGIVKRYAGVPALRGVDLALRPGTVVGLVGHNGAGKSTLLRTLAGATRPDEGVVAIDGRALPLAGPADALRAGVSTVYQELSLLANLTVTQNVYLGHEVRTRGVLDRALMRREAAALVQRFDLEVDVDRPVGDYPVATRQLLEIAIATHREVRYLLLDEPTTSLEGAQVARLLDLLSSLARERGLGVLLVDHKLDELYQVADTVVALVDGSVRIAGPARQVSRADVVRAIAGDEAATHLLEPAAAHPTGVGAAPRGAAPALRVRGLVTPVLRGVDLEAQPGRVLGLYGLVGSGRTEFLRALVGLERVLGGALEVHGRPYAAKDPSAAQRHGVVYLTEERKVDGIVPQLDAGTNVALPVLRSFTRFGVLDRRAARRRATELMDALRLRGDRSAPVVSLSGGNQQKVLLARALAQAPRVLLLDEPTKGVDIGVKSEIHRMVRRLAHEDGLTVVLVSSEEEEVLEVADDVAVFALGRCDGGLTAASSLTPADLRRTAWAAA